MPYTVSSTVKPNDTYTFTYDGLKWTGTIPAGAQSMSIYLWGGGGGGGAQETAGANGVGAGGHYVLHSSIDLTSHVGETIALGVGGGGGGGANGGGVAGGFNGRSLTGYSGGVGGSSGPNGSSGSGGGGGGATIIKINNIDTAVAAGGGAGGGGGADSQGGVGIITNSPTSASPGPGTLGENGTPHNGNGGGGGAGGGGVDGGIGGYSNDNDVGGNGGYSGSSLIPVGGTTTVASGQTPAGSSGGAGVGGNQGASGTNGKAIIIFTISADTKVKVDNAWKSITAIKFKHDGIWKNITAAYVKINGVWKAVFNTGFNWQSTAAGFGDATGNPYSDPYPGNDPAAPGGGGGGGCSIICTKLYELGYLSDEIYQADERFGHWLRQTDPNAYYGYLKWARVVVDWMSNEGPQCMFWIQDKKIRNEKQREMATRWARRIATPWAQHMAYKMGVLKEDNRAGRYIMNIGIAVSRLIGRFVKHTNQPTKNVAIGYAMWAMFGLLYMIAGVK